MPRRLGTGFRWLLASSWVSNLGDGIAIAAGPLTTVVGLIARVSSGCVRLMRRSGRILQQVAGQRRPAAIWAITWRVCSGMVNRSMIVPMPNRPQVSSQRMPRPILPR